MGAWRCGQCATNWPGWTRLPDNRRVSFGPRNCVECGGETRWVPNASAIDDDEARSRYLHVEFETFAARRDEEKRKALEAIDPEAVGDEIERELGNQA